MNRPVAKADELLFVVDDRNQPLDPMPRRIVHGSGAWHRLAHVWVVRNDGRILCQQRSLDKDSNPGYWESFFGGHMHPGETYPAAAQRELHEELGMTVAADALRLWKICRYADPKMMNNEFQAIFIMHWDGDLSTLKRLDGEVEQVAWKTIPEVEAGVAGNGVPWTNLGYEQDLLKDLRMKLDTVRRS